MRRMRSPSRSGAALLIVLGVLVMATSSTLILLRLATTAHSRARLDAADEIACDLLRACEEPIRHWLKTRSGRVVLPADAVIPSVLVLHDVIVAGDQRVELTITAFDQCGMLPVTVARSASPLRTAIDAEILESLDGTVWPRTVGGVSPGLDLVATPSAFPDVTPGSPTVFGDEGTNVEGDHERSTPPVAFGSAIATHPTGAINVHTAPMALIEAAVRVTGRGGIELIRAARKAGEPVTLPPAPPPAPGETGVRLALTTQSTSWAFRIDVHVTDDAPARSGSAQRRGVRRSWWAIHQPVHRQWECVQRLAITN